MVHLTCFWKVSLFTVLLLALTMWTHFVLKAVANVKLPAQPSQQGRGTHSVWVKMLECVMQMNPRGSDCSVPRRGDFLWLQYKRYTTHQHKHSNACTLATPWVVSYEWPPGSHPLLCFGARFASFRTHRSWSFCPTLTNASGYLSGDCLHRHQKDCFLFLLPFLPCLFYFQ